MLCEQCGKRKAVRFIAKVGLRLCNPCIDTYSQAYTETIKKLRVYVEELEAKGRDSDGKT